MARVQVVSKDNETPNIYMAAVNNLTMREGGSVRVQITLSSKPVLIRMKYISHVLC